MQSTRLADVFHWTGTQFQRFQLIREAGRYRIISLDSPSVPVPPLLTFRRLALYPSEGGAPLVVDVTRAYIDRDHERDARDERDRREERDPPGLRQSAITLSSDRRTATIAFGVRTVWFRRQTFNVTPRELIAFEITLEFSTTRGDYKSFRSPELNDRNLIDRHDRRLSEVLNDASPRPFSSDNDLQIAQDGLGIRWDNDVNSELRFVLQHANQGVPAFYRVEFLARLTAEVSNQAQLLRGFNQNFIANRFNRGFTADRRFPDADELIAFEAREQIPTDWVGQQVPTRELRPDKPPGIFNDGPRGLWLVLVEGIPSHKAANVWNAVAQGFHNSLQTVRAGNRVSFLPTLRAIPNSCTWVAGYYLIDAADALVPDYRIEGRGDCPQNALRCARLRTFSIWPRDACDIGVSFPNLFDESRNNVTGTLSLKRPERRYDEDFIGRPGLKLEASRLAFANRASIRIGALDLILAPAGTEGATVPENIFFQMKFERDAIQTPQERQLNVSLQTVLHLAQVLPGGEDAPSSSEFKTTTGPIDIFERDRPIVLPWGRQNAPNNFLYIIVNEDAGDDPRQPEREFSDTVTIELKNQKQTRGFEQKLIVIDPDPFSVVAVKFPAFDSQGNLGENTSVGIWRNNGAKWELKSLDDHFSLVLPPQVLGEEMEKHTTIPRGAAINFRFSQPTSLGLRQTTFRQNFREPPWNLRRILEPEDPQATGATVLFMQYELLYGLSCSFETRDTDVKNLRLMELFRRFGRIPGAINQRAKVTTGGKEATTHWEKLFRQYRARVGVFMPWESSEEKSLIINKGIQCVIRRNGPDGGANMAYPYSLFGQEGVDDFADPGTVQHYNQPLRGGTVWGFESRNIFTAVMRPNPVSGRIESNSARLVNPEFSSLGGWGHVSATFDNNRSAIYGDASMGRTFSYTLERIGRIGCFWNIAKHVIVYERHVANSKQFVCQQDELLGLPLLRKTDEYVEILEPTRTYPENPNAPRMQPGFVDGCHFTKGQRIKVDSQWGSDVGTEGWKVPLWNPTARPDVYPKPVFSIGLKTNEEGSESSCPGQIDDPENVFFYTSTNPNLKADPNIWDAVLDVDFVNIPLAEPCQGEYPNGSFVPVTPNDPPVAPGFKPCTFRIVKPATPTNIVANRADKALSTVLQNVTVMRAGVREVAVTADNAFNHLHNLRKNTIDIYAEIFKTLPEKGVAQVAELESRIDAAIETQRKKIEQVSEQLGSIRNKAKAAADAFEKKIFDREKEILDTFGQRFISFTQEVKKDYQSILDAIIASNLSPNDLRDRVTKAIDDLFQRTIDTIFMVPISSGILRRVVEQFKDALAGFKKSYEEFWIELDKTVTEVSVAKRTMLLDRLATIDGDIRVLVSKLETFRPRLPEAWIPDPQPVRAHLQRAIAALNNYNTRIEELKALLQTTTSSVDQIRTKIGEIRDLANGFSDPLTQLESLIDDQIQKKIREQVVFWLVDQRALITKVVDPLHADRVLTWAIDPNGCNGNNNSVYCKLRNRIGTDVNQIKNTVAELEALLAPERITEVINNLKRRIIDEEEKARLIALAANFSGGLLRDIDALIPYFAIQNNVIALKDIVKNKIINAPFAELAAFRSEVLDNVTRAYENNYRALQEATKPAFQSADSALRLVRAFGSPPAVPNLNFDRPEVAFFYKEAQRVVDITPVLARVNQAQAAADSLKALGIKLPTRQLFNDLIPKPLEDFDLRKIFPDFAGLKLENLLPGLKMPAIANDRVRVSHGVDPQTKRAWVQAVVNDVQITTPTKLFSIGPVELGVPKSSFSAMTRFEGGIGESPKRQVNARIMGDWDVRVGGQSMVLFKDTQLTYDDANGLKFRIEPSKIRLNGILNFISDLVSKFGGKDSGLSFGLLPDGGIQCVLALPLPNIQFGAFGISHLSLGALLALRLNDPTMGSAFSIELGFNVGRKLAPFALTVFLLGGGGYLELSTRYAPSNGQLRCSVSLGITVGASLALSLGPIHGGVYIFFGITAEFQSGSGGSKFAIGVMLLIRGEVSLLGIVEACITLLLEAQYDTTSGQIIGHGRLSISIEICWCFTLEISEEVTYTVGEGSKGNARLESGPSVPRRNAHHASRSLPAAAADYLGLVTDYVNMLA